MNNETICAIATSNNSIAGISIIRISGEKALTIASELLTKFKSLKIDNIQPRYMYLTDILLENNGKDKCLAVYFKAPHSFTGEDVVEIHLHGGIKLTEIALKKCLSLGCRLATRGEFSKRAFLNGKSSLESLEGVIDIINAESEAELSAGYNLANGKLSKELYEMQNSLTDIIAEIEVALDYPEEDIEYTTEIQVKEKLQAIYSKIEELISTSKNGKMIKNGINIAIVGKPNVGKSSLLNALLSYDRAIVTDIAGTTRDSIEESFEYKNVKFNICDTAGIRNAQDKVEIIGIDRAINQIKSSNIVLFVIDNSNSINNEDLQIIDIINKSNINTIVIKNKIDLQSNNTNTINLNNKVAEIEISAKNMENIDNIKELLYNYTIGKDFDSSTLMITNERHLQALKDANCNIKNAIQSIGNVSLDCVVLDIKESWNCLGVITGKAITEEVLDAIFTKFCLGK